MNYQPSKHCHVAFFSKQEAHRFDRRIYNVPKHCSLGWRPYTIRVLYRGCLAHCAFHSMREFKRWLGRGLSVRLATAMRRPGFRYGFITEAP